MPQTETSEPLRDRIGRELYEEPALKEELGPDLRKRNWYALSEERREPWRKDADRILPLVLPRLETAKGVSYLAKDSDGQWFYINHAGTWQTCPCPIPATE